MRVAVIGLSVLVPLDLHNHFGFVRRDCQLAFGLGDRVVLLFRTLVQRVGERVRALAHCRLASRHFIRRAFAVSKAVARYRHFAVRQRRAVVDLLIRSRGQRHRALADRQTAVCRLRNDILSCRVNRALSSGREVSFICSSIRSLRANFDRAEISVFRRSGKAGNALLFSIISLLVALRRQRDVLIIVEIDLVLSLGDRDRLLFVRFRRNCAAVNRGGGCLHLCTKRLLVNSLGIRNLSGRPVPVVVHRVAQVGSLRPLRGIGHIARHRLRNLRIPARKLPAGLAGRRCIRVIRVIFRCKFTKVCGVLVILCLKVAIDARGIRDRARDHSIEFIIEIDDLIKLIKRNRFSYIILLST